MLQGGQFGVETPVRARFSTPVQTGPEATLPPVQWVKGLSPMGKETRALSMHVHLLPMASMGTAIPLCTLLCLHQHVTGNLYLYFYLNTIFNKYVYKYILLYSLHFIVNTLLFSFTVQYHASRVTALHHIMSH